MGSRVRAGGLRGSVVALFTTGCVLSVDTEHHTVSDGTGDRGSSSGGSGTGGAPRGGSPGTGSSSVNTGGRMSGAGGTSSGGTASGGASAGGASSGGSGNAGTGGAPTCMPVMNTLEVGTWVEIAQIPCNGGPEHAPKYPIQELIFQGPGGMMNVTWLPFETYVDYWSTYTIGRPDGRGGAHITFMPTGGNYIPKDLDMDGSIARCGDELVLHDMWLGTSQDAINPNQPPPTPDCGHRFRKR